MDLKSNLHHWFLKKTFSGKILATKQILLTTIFDNYNYDMKIILKEIKENMHLSLSFNLHRNNITITIPSFANAQSLNIFHHENVISNFIKKMK